MFLDSRKIIVLTILTEGALLILSVLWLFFRPNSLLGFPGFKEIVFGVAAILPLLALGYLLSGPLGKHCSFLRPFRAFNDDVSRPLALSLSTGEGALVSILAGLGEEFFFRGVLLPVSGLLVSSILFSLLHFGWRAREFLPLVLLYFLIGLYLGKLTLLSGSIWTAVIAHALYDFIVLLYLKHFSDS